jgi:hypothetical protein
MEQVAPLGEVFIALTDDGQIKVASLLAREGRTIAYKGALC